MVSWHPPFNYVSCLYTINYNNLRYHKSRNANWTDLFSSVIFSFLKILHVPRRKLYGQIYHAVFCVFLVSLSFALIRSYAIARFCSFVKTSGSFWISATTASAISKSSGNTGFKMRRIKASMMAFMFLFPSQEIARFVAMTRAPSCFL